MNTINQLGIIFRNILGFPLVGFGGNGQKCEEKNIVQYVNIHVGLFLTSAKDFGGSLLIFQPKFLNIEKKRHEQSLLYFFDSFNIYVYIYLALITG